MNDQFKQMKTMKLWHVPCCIATMAMGVYISLVYFVPALAPEFHEMLFQGGLHKLVPLAIAVLVGSPLFSLWFYTKTDTDDDFRTWYFD